MKKIPLILNQARRAKVPLLIIISLALLTLILGGCPDVLSGKPDSGRPAPGTEINIPEGFGALRVNVTPGNARTALPELVWDKLYLDYFFTRLTDGDGNVITGSAEEKYDPPVVDNKLILETGTYELRIEAYDKETNAIVAEGYIDGKTIVIKNGQTTNVTVTLNPFELEGEGTLSFTIITDAAITNTTAQLAAFTLTNIWTDEKIDLYFIHYGNSKPQFNQTQTYPNGIPAGYYLLQMTLVKNTVGGSPLQYARKSEVVHIYQNLTTVTEYKFIDTDFAANLLVTNTDDSGPGSLRYAVENAVDGKVIRIMLDSDKRIELNGSLDIKGNKSITIESNNSVIITRASGFKESLFIIGTAAQSGTLTLGSEDSAPIIIDGDKDHITAEAALITVNNGTLAMNNGVTLRNNSNNPDDNLGGGVYVENGSTFTMKGGTISGNTAQNGGGVYVNGGTFHMKNGTIGDNTISDNGYGGGVCVENSGIFTMTNEGGIPTISGNKIISDNLGGSGYGGGVYISGEFTMSAGIISGNSTMDETDKGENDCRGGGVYVAKGTFIMNGGIIGDDDPDKGNTAFSNGGGVYVAAGGTFTMNCGTISGNTAIQGSGGGVFVNTGGTFTMTNDTVENTTIRNNTALFSGGGVCVWQNWNETDDKIFTMSGGTISGNTATATMRGGNGGGGVSVWYRTFKMTGGTIGGTNTVDKNTTTEGNGGGVHIYGGTFIMEGDAKVSGNEATIVYGGGVSVQADGTFTMNGGTISGNQATDGGGVYVDQGTFRISEGTVFGNGESEANISTFNGAALYLNIGTAEYGKDSNWNDLLGAGFYYSNTTIRVENGELVTVFVVNNKGGWDSALAEISGGGDNKSYIIKVTDSFKVDVLDYYLYDGNFGNAQNINVTITGDPNNKPSISMDPYTDAEGLNMFVINATQTVTIENIDIHGWGVNKGMYSNESLVVIHGIFNLKNGTISDHEIDAGYGYSYGGGVSVVSGGTFNMFSGGKISGNKISEGYGCGVYVGNGGTFNMFGGEISGNIDGSYGHNYDYDYDYSYSLGGGVYVASGGVFEMKGGEIKNHTVKQGGGVYVIGTFKISGGTVYGNDAGDEKSNIIIDKGAALYKSSSSVIAQYFNGTSWVDIPLTSNLYTNDTIKVKDGVLSFPYK